MPSLVLDGMWRMYRKIAIEWRIACLCIGFLIGVATVPLVQVAFMWGIGCLLFIGVFFIIGRMYAVVPLVLCSIAVGLGYGSAVYEEHYGAYRNIIGGEITLSGKVKEDVSGSTSGYRSLQLTSVQIRGSPYDGSVFARLRTSVNILRSDTVTVRGVAEEGFGNFSLNIKKASVVSVERQSMGDMGRAVRDWFAEKVRKLIKEPQASLGIGYLTGQKSALPEDLSEALKIAGLTHIVVASGYNLTILVRMARRLFLPVSKFTAAMAALGMVFIFMAVTGLSPSMTRAGIVSGLSILFWYYGRKIHPIVLLLFVAMLTVVYQPSYLWGDLGWQLSFSAFFGVMIVGPLLQYYFYGSKRPGIIRQTLGETVAAHIVTIPIIALQFGVMSNVAIIANILVVPLVPLAMLLTFICGIWAIFGIGLSEIVATPTNLLLEYMVAVARYVAEIGWAQVEVDAAGWMWGVYIAALVAVCFWMWRATRYNLRTSDALNPLQAS